ncbi:MAG: hypothetical protein IT425_06265 [Pirellulales bacterium]|nr:hypothetical protein [Pirellulales bacterium]
MLLALPVLVAMISVGGCGSRDPLGRHSVSGTITHRGNPVPKGFIRFSPDTAKGQSGPGGGAPIVQGKFSAEAKKGVLGGHYLVEIVGLDGIPTKANGEDLPDGKELFPTVRLSHEFPNADVVWNYDVP